MGYYLYEHENKIKFRKIEEYDLATLLQLKNESWFGTHTITIANTTNQINWFKSLCNEDISCPKNLVLIAMTKVNEVDTDCPIGIFKILQIDWQSRRAEAGWDIYKNYRGFGYGKKLVKAGISFSFEILNLRRLSAQILETNKASQKCAEAAGFEIEGRQRQMIHKKGKYIDNLIYGILNVSYS